VTRLQLDPHLSALVVAFSIKALSLIQLALVFKFYEIFTDPCPTVQPFLSHFLSTAVNKECSLK
jgi:hypothetical protein